MAKRRGKKFAIQIDAKKAARVITAVGVFSAIFLTIFVWVFYQPGRHTHAHLVNERTKLRLTFQPAMIQDYLSSLAPGITRFVGVVPKFTSMQARAFRVDWIHALPYEITFLGEQGSNDAIGMTVFVNPIPDNNSFVGEVNGWGALGRMPTVRWEGGQLLPAGEQQFTAKGSVPVAADIAAALGGWPRGAGGSLQKFDGGHFLELDIENSGGILLALHRAFGDSLWEWTSAETEEALVNAWPQIAKVQVFGDLSKSDELTFEVKVIGTNAIDRENMNALFTAAADELGVYLSENERLTFTGSGTWDAGVVYTGTYRLGGFEARIRSVWQ